MSENIDIISLVQKFMKLLENDNRISKDYKDFINLNIDFYNKNLYNIQKLINYSASKQMEKDFTELKNIFLN